MNPPPNPAEARLDYLFLRYWDHTLSDAEADELDGRLAADPAARAWFQLLAMQAATAAELGGVAGAVGRSVPAPPPPPARFSRRAWALVGGGVAAGLAFGVGRWLAAGASGPGVRATDATGTVTVQDAGGRDVAAGGPVPDGATVSTLGMASSVVLTYPDGSGVTLSGDSAVTVLDAGQRVVLRHGTATAAVRPRPADSALTLVTAQVTVPRLSGVLMTLEKSLPATAVMVHSGLVSVSAHTGRPLDPVRAGELLTVRADGDSHREPLTEPPARFRWDLTAPLAEDWHVGVRQVTPDGPVVRTEWYEDPYHNGARMSQIRSDKQWTRGFFRFTRQSVLRVRYWVDRPPARGQVCFCVRTGDPRCSETGMLDYAGAFSDARPREWQWLEARADLLLANRHSPAFGPPWVGFLVIFNTFEEDVGLKVAEFRVEPADPV